HGISVKEILIILKELKEEDFKEFKWHLNHPSPEDHRSIPRSDLENKDRMDTVDLMEQYYGKDSVQVAVEVLKEIQRNDLAEKLSKMNFYTTGKLLKSGRKTSDVYNKDTTDYSC
uniref:Pyrin domain-containing protein n=1 Tax=Gasterosteus aculeatus aculeatus TaxID=481459 RepID=G3NAR5_GASAC